MSQRVSEVTLVTGGARGQGAADAAALAASGVRVVIADVQDEDGAANAQRLTEQGCRSATPASTSPMRRRGPKSSPASRLRKAGWTSWSTTPASSGSPG